MLSTNRLKLYIAVSIFAHIAVAVVLYVLPTLMQLTKIEAVEVVILEEPPQVEEVIQTQKQEEDLTKKQIVETDEKTANEEMNKNAKFLSAKNNTVEKETKAATGDNFKNSKQQAQPQVAQQEQKPQAKTTESKPKILDSGFDAYSALNKREHNKEEIQKERRSKAGTAPGDASMTNDNLDNVDNGLITQLNTKEYKYYGYYHRIKLQLNQWWQPKVKEKVTKLMSQGRTIASQENKVTKLIIILNQQGTLVKVQVLSESGVRDLDDAAVDAFRQAAPFPNPPKGMVENDGTIKIRWDFVVES